MSAAGEGFISGRLARALGRRPAAAGASAAGAARGRPLTAARAGATRRRPRLRWGALVAVAAAIALLTAGWMWLRDSSLVAVQNVAISGVRATPGTQGARVRAALTEAARSMTTLHVRRDALETAVAPFALVKRIEVETDFPDTMRIHVVTNVAVGAVVVDGRRIAVTSDGTLLRDMSAPAGLPEIPLESTPTGSRLSGAAARAVAALGAAPDALRKRVEGVFEVPGRGLEIQLAHGPRLRFGSAERLEAKWAAAAAVLADAAAAGASAIDVTAPEHPAVSGLPGGAPAAGAEGPETVASAATEPQPIVEIEGGLGGASTLNPE